MKKLFILFLLSGACFFFCSCQSYTPAFVLSLHEFSDPRMGENLSKKVRNSSREFQYTLKTSPFLDARYIMQGKVYGPNKKGLYGIRLVVDMWRQNSIHQMAVENIGQVFAVVVDGTYIGTSHFTEEMTRGEILTIEPLWNLYDATQIVENIEDNRIELNPWHTKPFNR